MSPTADQLRRDLFALLTRFKDFDSALWAVPGNDYDPDARGDANEAAGALARTYEQIAALPTFRPGGPGGA